MAHPHRCGVSSIRTLSSGVQPADQFECHFMFQHKRLIHGKEYKPAGSGGHRGYDLRCEGVKDLPYRISVLHLLPRYAQRAENPPRTVSARWQGRSR